MRLPETCALIGVGLRNPQGSLSCLLDFTLDMNIPTSSQLNCPIEVALELPGSGRCRHIRHRSPGRWERLWPSHTHSASARRWPPTTSSHLDGQEDSLSQLSNTVSMPDASSRDEFGPSGLRGTERSDPSPRPKSLYPSTYNIDNPILCVSVVVR